MEIENGNSSKIERESRNLLRIEKENHFELESDTDGTNMRTENSSRNFASFNPLKFKNIENRMNFDNKNILSEKADFHNIVDQETVVRRMVTMDAQSLTKSTNSFNENQYNLEESSKQELYVQSNQNNIPYENLFIQNYDDHYVEPFPHYMMPLEDAHCDTYHHDSGNQRSGYKENKWLTNSNVRKSREIGDQLKKMAKNCNENTKPIQHKKTYNHYASIDSVDTSRNIEEVKPQNKLPKKPKILC